ncbi:MAG: hypothetical protein ACHP65_07585 [Legionellales bacterium]
MNIDLDTKCIPLAHMQSYFDLRKGIVHDIDWFAKRTKIQISNPNEILEVILGINPDDFYRNAGINYHNDNIDIFISARQCMMLVDQAMRALDMPFLGLVMGNLMTYLIMAWLALQPSLNQILALVSIVSVDFAQSFFRRLRCIHK